MILGKIAVLIEIVALCFAVGCNTKTDKETLKTANKYGFETMVIEDITNNQHSVLEYEKLYEEITNMSDDKGMDEVILTVNGVDIKRIEFETNMKIKKFKNSSVTTKEVIYSIIRPVVIKTEAQRLNLEPTQDKIDIYIDGVKATLENHYETSEYLYAQIMGRGMTKEEYLNEQKKIAYDMYQRECLYEYIENNSKESIDLYINKLIKYADIKFYDSIIEEECL